MLAYGVSAGVPAEEANIEEPAAEETATEKA
jgi:hypothetical protein